MTTTWSPRGTPIPPMPSGCSQHARPGLRCRWRWGSPFHHRMGRCRCRQDSAADATIPLEITKSPAAAQTGSASSITQRRTLDPALKIRRTGVGTSDACRNQIAESDNPSGDTQLSFLVLDLRTLTAVSNYGTGELKPRVTQEIHSTGLCSGLLRMPDLSITE